uniref:Amine oxidase domain-containing protein n=1 Tax=Entomoneis paludosa TaxID=265537 RepID=A0A7S2VFR3_9STRA
MIRASIRRHFQIMRRVNEQVNDMYHEGLGMEANTDVTLSSALQHWNKAVPLDNNSDEKLSANTIQSLTNFYQHMLTYWQGLGLGEIPIAQYGGFDDSDDDDDDDPLEDDDEFDQDGDFGGAHCTIQQGMQQVVQGLAVPDLVEQIQLQQEVIRIEQVNQQQQQQQNEKDQPYRVRVETKDGSIIYARSCAVTIPIGCLRDNYQELFASPLSPEKVEAFQTLTMGRYKKVFLTFDAIFWPAQQAFLGMNIPPSNAPIPHPLGTCLLIDNFWAKDGHACMEAILAGDQARWATHKSDEMIRETVLEFIRTAMNLPYKLQDKCLDCHITRWEEDPFCKGAYAAMSMGGLQRHIDAVTEPEWDGCLYFAGDVCSVEFEGSVSAAMFSGRYTGRNMAQYLRNQRGTGPTEQSTISNGVVTSGEEVLETFPKEKEQLLSSVSYEDHDWRELPNHVQQAATQLGYNKRMWDRDLEPPSADLDWDELSPEQQRSASVIGFNKETWDCE